MTGLSSLARRYFPSVELVINLKTASSRLRNAAIAPAARRCGHSVMSHLWPDAFSALPPVRRQRKASTGMAVVGSPSIRQSPRRTAKDGRRALEACERVGVTKLPSTVLNASVGTWGTVTNRLDMAARKYARGR